MKLRALAILLLASPSVVGAAKRRAPFIVTVVPSGSGSDGRYITLADEQPHAFYVIVTNTSTQPQPVWQTWCSWGYWTISFDITTTDGKHFSVSKSRDAVFTRNYPATFLIPPGEHQVYLVRLDKEWTNRPKLPKASHTPITIKAIYEVIETPESRKHKVWAGRVESKTYSFTLSHW